MRVLVLIVLLIFHVQSEMKSYQAQSYVSRKSRSNSPPQEVGYSYSQVNNDPGTLLTYDSGVTHDPIPSNLKTKNSHFLPSKMDTDAMYEKLKTFMHYRPTPEEITDMNSYGYNIDSDDVRTSSRNYDNWPYQYNFFNTPYDYDSIKMGTLLDSAKDKRSTLDSIVIPVFENINEDPPPPYSPVTARYVRDMTTHYPYVDSSYYNDYDYYKNPSHDEDTFTLGGLGFENNDDKYYYPKSVHSNAHNSDYYGNYDKNHVATGEKLKEKQYDNSNEYKKYAKGNQEKANDRSAYEHAGNNYQGFKHFADNFANRYGAEDHNKDSKYSMKRIQDKADKKKGFHRVYHKDEYQMDNEFYDNNGHVVKAEENADSKTKNGGNIGSVQSHSLAALGEEANAFNKAGLAANNRFENSHIGHDAAKGLDRRYNGYKDIENVANLNNRHVGYH